MSIQPINYQSPSFGQRLPLEGKTKQVEEVFNAILAKNPGAKKVTTNKGRLAYIVTKEDVSRVDGKATELPKDEFQRIAGTAQPLSAKDVIKAIKSGTFDFDLLNMPR